METLPTELTHIIDSYVKETESEQKFLAKWLKMSYENKQQLLKEYDLQPISSYRDLRTVRFSLPDGLSTLDVCERVLDYALLNEIPDYDGYMAFSIKLPNKYKTKRGGKKDYLPKDTLILSKSSDTAQLLYQLYQALAEDVLEEFEGFIEEDRDLSILAPQFASMSGDPYRILDGPFFLKEGSKNEMITEDTVYEMLMKKRLEK